MDRLPIVFADVEVSRNLRRHVLRIPGEENDQAFNTLARAVTAILAHGFDRFVLHAGDAYYLVEPAQLSLLDAGADELPVPPGPCADS